jgi:hypothetical protein
MKRSAIRALLAFIALVGIVAGAVFMFASYNSKNRAIYDQFVQTCSTDMYAAEVQLRGLVTTNGDFSLWLKGALGKLIEPQPHDLLAAHVYCDELSDHFNAPFPVLRLAYRYRYSQGLDILNGMSLENAEGGVDFYKAGSVSGKHAQEILFWFSFFNCASLVRYFNEYSFEDFQSLCRAMVAYPWAGETYGTIPGFYNRAITEFCISRDSARMLLAGEPSLPYGLSLPYAFVPPASFAAISATDAQVDNVLAQLRGRPERMVGLLATLAGMDSQRAHDIVAEELTSGHVPESAHDELLEPAWYARIPVPIPWIQKGLGHSDEQVRIFAMLHSLLLPGTQRLEWVRNCLTLDINSPRILLVHRLEADDLDSGMIQHLNKLFAASVPGGPKDKALAVVIATKIYEVFGTAGLSDTFSPRLFEEHPAETSEILTLFGCPYAEASHKTFIEWLPSTASSPVWWVVGNEVIGDLEDPKSIIGEMNRLLIAEKYLGTSLEAHHRWRPWFVIEELRKADGALGHPFAAMRMFGLVSKPDVDDHLRAMFESGDAGALRIAFADRAAATAFFNSFRADWRQR